MNADAQTPGAPVGVSHTRWYPVLRAALALTLISIGGSAMYFAIVGLKPVGAEFGISRSLSSLPYTFTMVGFGLGGIAMGWVSDRVGVMPVTVFGGVMMAFGFTFAGHAESIHAYTIYHGVLLALLGCSALMAPLVADISHWFDERRGLAVGIVISGAYVAGTIWPLVAQHYFDLIGWRHTYLVMGWFCMLTVVPLGLLMTPRAPISSASSDAAAKPHHKPLGLNTSFLQSTLCLAGLACCAAMAMPQVHIVAHASDLGFAAARGAEMLALMLGGGIISRLGSGWLSDRIGGLRTLALGSLLQGIMVTSFVFADGLNTLYLLALLFGLSQGGIVPSYTIIIRRYFNAGQAGWRIGVTLLCTMLGMALGGQLGGAIFDLTGTYTAAFLMGTTFNVLHLAIAVWLLWRAKRSAT
jgi:MFS family permease